MKFCTKCGNEVSDAMRFCSKCGQKITHIYSDNTPQQYLLTIVRANQWFAINPAVKIIVDGNREFKIDNGTSMNIPISIGRHNINFSCSIRNKVVNINVQSNMTLHLKWNRITGSLEVK